MPGAEALAWCTGLANLVMATGLVIVALRRRAGDNRRAVAVDSGLKERLSELRPAGGRHAVPRPPEPAPSAIRLPPRRQPTRNATTRTQGDEDAR